MTWTPCPKCAMMVAEPALALHTQLNHPKRAVTPATLAALAKAQATRRAEAVRLDAAWAGRTS